MATLDVSSASAVLKSYYTDQRVQQLTYKDAPFFAMLKKRKDFVGANYPLPMKVTNPQGRSATFSNAVAQKQPSNYKSFTLTRVKDYSLASITTEAILASESNPGAFLRLATGEIDGALDSLKRSISFSLYGDSSGSIGVVSAITAANPVVVTLSQVDDIAKFEIGQTVLAYDTTNTTARLWGTGAASGLISNVDRDLGKITIDVDGSGGQTAVATDLIFVSGDRNLKMAGLGAWVPASAPGSTAFFGVDRSIDVTRLGGIRISSSGKPLDEALIDAARRVGREGGTPDYVFCSYSKYASLEKTLGNRVIYDDIEVAKIAFRGISISGPKGKMTVLPDQDCPNDKMYMLDMSSWGLYSLREPVMLVDLDGNKMLREASADAYEVRCAFYGNLGCVRPGSNAVLTF